MLLQQLRALNPELQRLASRYGGSHLRVFGSVARGEESPQSDVDFLVVLPRGYDIFSQRLPLTQDLSDLLQRRVELVPEHELSPHIRSRVLAEAVEL
ncbi:predicted nucleotidyltransferase [Serpentinimonas raichei]|jgi:predicted nucleotidyltransferase|uniref:Predicted nucleotidyltransferase n=1 Tax=Serpentinimonas raichei TaxID=1458425 RepID=A0A060NMN2_9BURK|nr:nucleotidyltransferase [Serpentinimonas raichei]BAO80773.1 predicted nucleotidyltransferase [Serpentinimonas raichei]